MILLPSYNRPSSLKRFFIAYKDTGAIVPGIVLIDSEDWLSLKTAYEALSLPPGWEIVKTKGRSMGDKVREVWPIVRSLDWAMILNDDHIPVTKNWDTLVIEALTGDNFVTTNDGWQANQGRAAGATAWSGDLMRAIGYIFPPGLQHLYVDDLWETLGRSTRCWDVLLDVLIEHRHAFRTGVLDQTHTIGYSNFQTDRKIYEDWLKDDMPGCALRIAALKENFAKRVKIVT